MLAKSPYILIALPPNMTSWVAPSHTIDINCLDGVRGREPFTELQREHQADHQDHIANGEVRIGRRG